MKTIDPQNPNHIMIGLGGTGGKVLKAFRKRIWEEFPKEEDREKLAIGYVYVDSTDEMMNPDDPTWHVFGQNAQFKTEEFVNIKEIDLDMILRHPENFPGLRYVIGNNANLMRQTLGEVGKAAGQKRRAGRILFGANVGKYLSAVKRQWNKVKEVKKDANKCTIHIFTGLAGGTGSGSIVDAIAQLRADDSLGGENMTINVYAMVPELDIPDGLDKGRYHENGFAALCELSAFNAGSWLPSDIRTGDEHIRINTLPKKQFGLMLYSDVNENGTKADSLTDLPKLLSDMVYFNIFTGSSDNTERFKKGYNNENANDYLVEYNYLADEKIPARTKATNSFGIKRIVYPEQRIVEHISYTISNSILSQIVYNNYKEDAGFVDEAVVKDYKELYVDDPGQTQLRKWKLTDDFLTLNELILEGRVKSAKFEDYWRTQVEFNSYDDVKSLDSEPLNYVRKFCQGKFDSDFRLKKGVAEYFNDKSEQDTLERNTDEIINSIERDLYAQWYDGVLSLNDLQIISRTLLDYLRKRLSKLESDILECEKRASDFQEELDSNVDYYNHLNALQRIGRAPRQCYFDHQQILIDLYTQKTLRLAYDFTNKLLRNLISAFDEFCLSVQGFVSKIQECKKYTISRISERNERRGNVNDLKDPVIEVKEEEKIKSFERSILLDQGTMRTLSNTLRHKIVEERTFAHFSGLMPLLDSERFFNVVDNVLGTAVRDMQNQKRQEERITGINILQQLQKILITDDDINRFAHNALETSGVFILLDNTELNSVNRNNENPNLIRASINIKNVQVTFPTVDGNDELRAFAEKLKNAFKNHFRQESDQWTIDFNYSDDIMNEITIASIKSLFPIRAIRWMSTYRNKYDAMTTNSNQAQSLESKMILHLEGDGSQLPPVMGERTLAADEMGPYLFLAVAFAIITEDDDEYKGHGWVLNEKDEFGSTIRTFMSRQFSDMANSPELSPERRNRIVKEVDKRYKDTTLTMTQRDGIIDSIKALMSGTVVKECSNNTSSPRYQTNANDARKAIAMIKI